MSLTGKIISKSSTSGVNIVRGKNGIVSAVVLAVHLKKRSPIGSSMISHKNTLNRVSK